MKTCPGGAELFQDMKKPIVGFRNIANAPKKSLKNKEITRIETSIQVRVGKDVTCLKYVTGIKDHRKCNQIWQRTVSCVQKFPLLADTKAWHT